MSGSGKHYVAVVDDDESVGRSLARLLCSADFDPVTYLSAEVFLEDTMRPRFGCIVLDFQLQGISGLDLARRLAAINDRTPILLLTGRDEPTDRAAAQAAGCAGYFRKTDIGSEILDWIRDAVRCPVID
jgi:FixJ family two-component response regulator